MTRRFLRTPAELAQCSSNASRTGANFSFALNSRPMTAQRFQGKVAVVTGGNSGIGLGVAKAYAREGAQVAITGRNEKTLEAAAKEIGDGTLAIQSDAGKVAEIETAMKKIKERFGRIDAMFVNAGVAKLIPFDEVTEDSSEALDAVPITGVRTYPRGAT